MCACSVGVSERDFLAVLTPAVSGVQLSVEFVEYDLASDTRSGIVEEMLRYGPRRDSVRFAATVAGEIEWSFRLSRHSGACYISSADVRVHSRVVLPRATALTDSSDLGRWWQDFRSQLVVHEAGHVRIALEFARQISTAIRKQSRSSCLELGERANDVAYALLARSRREQAAYDVVTAHGLRP